MKTEIKDPICLNCQLACYTGGQVGYAELTGTPLTKSCAIYCTVRHEYVFKDFSCEKFVERHEGIK